MGYTDYSTCLYTSSGLRFSVSSKSMVLYLAGRWQRGRDVFGLCNTGVPPELEGVRGGKEDGEASRLDTLFKCVCMICDAVLWHAGGSCCRSVVNSVMLQLNIAMKAADAALRISRNFWSAVHVRIFAKATGVSEEAVKSPNSITSTKHLRYVRVATFTLQFGVWVWSTKNRMMTINCWSQGNESLK